MMAMKLSFSRVMSVKIASIKRYFKCSAQFHDNFSCMFDIFVVNDQ